MQSKKKRAPRFASEEGDERSPGDTAESWMFVPLMVPADILQASYYTEDQSTAPTAKKTTTKCCDFGSSNCNMMLEQIECYQCNCEGKGVHKKTI